MNENNNNQSSSIFDDIDFTIQYFENIKKANQEYEEAKRKAYEKQKKAFEIKRKKQRQAQIKRAITTIALATTLAAGSFSIAANAKNDNKIEQPPKPSVFTSIAADNYIDNKISNYKKEMDNYSGPNNSIETFIEYYNNEAQVKYTEKNLENLANKIVEAANISESEARCVIIAAYNIINEPYRDEVIEKAFEKADKIQKSNENQTYNYDIPKSTNEFLRSLGYDNWEEYHNNERESIKETRAIEETIGGKNR